MALETEVYARSIVRLDIDKPHADEVARKIVDDLANHGLVMSLVEVHRQMQSPVSTEHRDRDN